nr:PHD finger protein 3-like isoform X1 [Oncorhynchus nerka]
MIEKEQREAERRPITKITHKGEIEIESQESGKAPEAIEPEPEPVAASKVTEEPVEVPQEKTLSTTTESVNIFQDTTSLHKTHLFDLNCKICTGRMAPPVEEAPTKVVKVATSVVRRRSATSTTEAVTKNTQSTTSSTTEGQTTNTLSATTTSTEGETPSSAKDDDLHLKVLEESLLSAKTFSNYKGRYVDQSVNYPEQSITPVYIRRC